MDFLSSLHLPACSLDFAKKNWKFLVDGGGEMDRGGKESDVTLHEKKFICVMLEEVHSLFQT